MTSKYHPRYVLLHFARGASDPIERADLRTSMSDARIAVCLACGVALEDIDPASGYSISEDSYRRVRASWVGSIEQHGWAPDFRPHSELPEVFSRWQARRSDLTAADSPEAWVSAGVAAHRAYWSVPGRSCNRPDCDLHGECAS